MAKLLYSTWMTPPALPIHPQFNPGSISHITISPFAASSGGLSLNSILKKCDKCEGKGAVECPGCKGTGRNKKNGNIFERWKCFECQGFGMKGCPSCGKGGLTPEQRGER